MRKVIAAINTTLDAVCDHTAGIPDQELHHYYAGLLSNADAILFGRKTYQLMEFWRSLVEKPSGEKSMDDFAAMIDKIQKIVFSRTLDSVDWKSARLADQNIEKEIARLKQQSGKDILIGSRSLILQLMKLDLIDQYQLCVHPIVAGSGLPLFEDIDRTVFKLTKTKIFGNGAVMLYYEPTNKSAING